MLRKVLYRHSLGVRAEKRALAIGVALSGM